MDRQLCRIYRSLVAENQPQRVNARRREEGTSSTTSIDNIWIIGPSEVNDVDFSLSYFYLKTCVAVNCKNSLGDVLSFLVVISSFNFKQSCLKMMLAVSL